MAANATGVPQKGAPFPRAKTWTRAHFQITVVLAFAKQWSSRKVSNREWINLT